MTQHQTLTPPRAGTPADRAEPAPPRSTPPWAVVTAREVVVKLTDRNFIVSTLITIALLAGTLALQVILGSGTKDVRVSVTGPDARQVVERIDGLANQRDQPLRLVVTEAPDAGAVEAAVRDEAADAGLVKEPGASGGWRLVGKTSTNTALAAAVRESVRSTMLERNAAAAGTTAKALTAGSDLRLDVLKKDDNPGVKLVVGFAFGFLFYMASLLFGMAIATSVVEEKQSRVVEILVSAVPIRQLLLGKVLGNTVLALSQMALFVGVGLIGVSFTAYAPLLPALAASAGWFLVFFLVGFVALACLWAVAGSLATRNEDLQSTTPLLTTVLVMALMLGIIGEGVVRTVGSYVPIVSTVAMPQRLLAGDAVWWEPFVSLLVTVAFAAVSVVVGERFYRRSVMQTQRRMTIREVMRAAD